jgi:hypothetical protein
VGIAPFIDGRLCGFGAWLLELDALNQLVCDWCGSSRKCGESPVGEEFSCTFSLSFKLFRFLNHCPGDFDLNSFSSFSGSFTFGIGIGVEVAGGWEVLNTLGGKGGNGGGRS